MDSDNWFDRILRKAGLKSKGKKDDAPKKDSFEKMQLKDYASFGISEEFMVKSPLVQSGKVAAPRSVSGNDFFNEYFAAVNSLKRRNNKAANDLIKAFSRVG